MTQPPPEPRSEPQPGEHEMSLVVPFIVCRSNGGPYDDDAFVAGYQCGQIDHALRIAAAVGAETVRFPIVRTDLLKQLDLHGMRHGFPYMSSVVSGAVTEWCEVTFATSRPEPETETPA